MATHIDIRERRVIERALKKEKGVNQIARDRKRAKSTVSEEIRLGTKDGVYRATYANAQAKKRRKQAKQQCLKVAMDPKLKEYVTREISSDQSPEAVSGRIKEHDTHMQYASPKAIYKFIHSPHGGPLEHHLHRKRVKRKGGPKRGTKRACDTTKHMITERPVHIQERKEYGHYEGDFIVSGKNGKGMREFIPKGCDISNIPDETIREAELHLNTRYMKCLNWCTPLEAWEREVVQWNKEQTRARVRKNAQCAVV